MSTGLRLFETDACIEVWRDDGAPLFTYVYRPATPANESPRPYLHPVYSPGGDVLTCFRPNDHPWHHALSLTLSSVNGINFWGGPSFRAADGYQWRDDHGEQVHVGWRNRSPQLLEHELHWRTRKGKVLLLENRVLRVELLDGDGWALEWTSDLQNVTEEELVAHNYHSDGGLAGSHYTGLQFRGARGLLDDHGDARIRVVSETGAEGDAVHGQSSHWIEWQAQSDTSLRRTRIRFSNIGQPLPWFLRKSLPLAAFSPHCEHPLVLRPGEQLCLEHRIEFARLPS